MSRTQCPRQSLSLTKWTVRAELEAIRFCLWGSCLCTDASFLVSLKIIETLPMKTAAAMSPSESVPHPTPASLYVCLVTSSFPITPVGSIPNLCGAQQPSSQGLLGDLVTPCLHVRDTFRGSLPRGTELPRGLL